LIKPIQDALQGVVYWNDRQVSDTIGNRRRIDGSFVVKVHVDASCSSVQ
jgi:hypothetical protein